MKDKFTAENILVKQANNDADVLIIETAIEQSHLTNSTIVVGEDVDLLVLLTARTPAEKNRKSSTSNVNINIFGRQYFRTNSDFTPTCAGTAKHNFLQL